MSVVKERRGRSDKKKAIAAPMDRIAVDQLSKLSYICDLPVKVICESLCREAYRKANIIEKMRSHFRRDLVYNDNQIFFGDNNKESYRLPLGEKKRLYMRFYQFEHDRIAALAYSLDCAIQVAAALLLTIALKDKKLVYSILARYINVNLDLNRSKQLRQLCRVLDQQSDGEYITIPMVVAHAIKISYDQNVKVKHTINEWSNS